ncbi:outer membrane beta-barrel protein [Janthinobacterium sp. 17J80-10]|uniref:outer membrane beta-barrel protein n=1 Tax=Janthinobacterium sp. 17J80-10 TaxID=2497863 RepID=UPI001005565B|nr:outer membrane beta-barrel protein [Janthinobacterium sp. 17J80-10]QAU35493.1 flagellar motor protein MotB [Janthinobacterium sp. 17J80-10]
MKLASASRALGLIALAAITSPFAMADETNQAGWYAGANIGQSRATIDDARISSSLLNGGFSSSTITDDDRATGYKVLGGYQLNRNLALEGGYFDLGKFGYTANTIPAGTLTGNAKIRGLNLDLVGILPITEKFSAFGRAGVTYAQTRDRFVSTGAVTVTNPNPSKRAANYKLGVGLQYAFTDALAMRGEVERYRINDAVGNKGDIELISVGLVYRFGAKTPTPAARVDTPVFVAAAPASQPAPVTVIPAPAPVATRVSFAADSLFDFDKTTLKLAGKQALDKLAADLKGTAFDVVIVTGHTDRLGSHAYNVKLSSRRAEAVKAYLAQSAGIPAVKITSKGVNGADPVTKPGECKGTKASSQLIACLQPDRRVEVQVSGTR